MKCRLCEHESELARSHILPELVYRPCYDAKHRVFQHALPSLEGRFIQKGTRERLLCSPCEERLSDYETYFSRVWYGPRALRPASAPPPGFVLQGIDYTRFKLFHLSILWRAGVSTHAEFKSVRLGPHESRLASLLRLGEAGPANRYPVGAVGLVEQQNWNFLEGAIVSPRRRRVEGHTVYLFVFGGCMWCYGVSNHEAPWFPNALSEDGSLTVVTQAFNEFPPMQELLRLYARGMRSVAQ